MSEEALSVCKCQLRTPVVRALDRDVGAGTLPNGDLLTKILP